ncbi:hypothetical protein GYMLUDRAFT_40612 [Collybiopsis luxurians FD-317 M1]|uniref:FYVE-type domain-containing protein n=1 Tax=Collybiopsis luxurians FD-317 M1 TaxID=944289 RepID=A0A0D0C644_9AGAR|nr:hypothetical protein GYMLUDRAFT_40612 [Collybiopsis luxurians FD-317 M1]
MPNWTSSSPNQSSNVTPTRTNGTKAEILLNNQDTSLKVEATSKVPFVEGRPAEEPPSPATMPISSIASSSSSSSTTASSSSATSSSRPAPTPSTLTSTFRRVRPPTSSPLARPSSMLMPNQNGSRSTSSPLARPSSMLILDRSDSAASSMPSSPTSTVAPSHALSTPAPTPIIAPSPAAVVATPSSKPTSPPPSSPSPSRFTASTPAPSVVIISPSDPRLSHTPSPAPPSAPKQPKKAPYLPGFQPRGVCWNRTDEFLISRKLARNGPESSSEKRVERTKLERRLEKIIALHFPDPSTAHEKEKEKLMNGSPIRPSLLGNSSDSRRRTSSFFEGLDIRRMSSSFLGNASEAESIRSAEQRISPWQPDSAVSRCPHCDASFHPLSNRKHHCRLCGRVVCALGVRKPQRPEPCSILFVIDPKTRQIEQVEEGVDYGVRKRKASVDMRSINSNGKTAKPPGQDEEDEESQKFLRGVRVCRECKPVLLRQQYLRERTSALNGDGAVGEFLRLYEAFLSLEKEIEESLPQFEELLTSLRTSNTNSNEAPTALTATAAAERKRLLQSFAAYDAITKKIRSLPCKDTKGGSLKTAERHSQERVQAAIGLRGARFLEARMVGLGAVPVQEHKRNGSKSKGVNSKSTTPPAGASADDLTADSALHAALQPLLEQESLLESYVAEATAARKFEDAKTLRGNLKEIRNEIERLVKASGG